MDKVTISKDLLHQILVFFARDMEPSREYLTDEAPEAVIFDTLFYDEFPPSRLEELFPGEFAANDDEMV